MDIVRHCTCNNGGEDHSGLCGLCGSYRSVRVLSRESTSGSLNFQGFSSGSEEGFDGQERGGMYNYIPRLIGTALSGALTGIFALAGAFTGAVTGALAGRASDSGVIRGAGLGAVAGAILSVEVLEASRAYWCSERSGIRSSSSMADFIEELLHGRFVHEQFAPMFTAYRLQVSIGDVSYDQIYDAYGETAPKGISSESLKQLPFHVVTAENRGSSDGFCCTICLQEIEVGDTVRNLQRCSHTFHMTCVDKWLVGHGSCPVCRQDVALS